ncbi:MAG: aldo/keto reductase [Planctomycetota bacterium]
MQTTTLGRTGVNVSIAGLGCGGPSRLGLREGYGNTEDDAVRVVRHAIDKGVTLIDTARAYGTEPVVGRAIRESGRRDELFITSKFRVGDHTPEHFAEAIDTSLAELGVDMIDAYHVHGVSRDELPRVMDQIVPVLRDVQAAGKIRFLAISELFQAEPSHAMARDLYAEPEWAEVFDILMVGFNLLNPSARRYVLPHTRRLNIGTLCMFAVRRALTDPTKRAEVLDRIDMAADVLDFLGDGPAITDAGYRFARHEPGIDVTLFGTGNTAHLDANLASINADPLDDGVLQALEARFGKCESVSGN